DTDGDGTADNLEASAAEALDPCLPVQAAGYTGYDATNAIWAAADCDGDGVGNGDEDTNGTDPYQTVDTDGDGIDDDNEVNNGTDPNDPCDPVQSPGYTGYDSGNVIWAAADCDGDGVTNGDEVTNGTDPYEASNDTDGDGIDDDTETNNGTDPMDPCDPVQNPGYTGYNSANTIWAGADCDGDTLTNSEELSLGTEIYAADTDGDTINDGQEVSDGTDPFDDCDSVGGTPLPDTFCDRDDDGLSDADEITAGTDPDNPDSDGDTIEDGQEVSDGTDPLDPCDSNGGTPTQGTICGVEIGNSIVTPDGDGVNDFFRIENIELFGGNSVEIINRWGAPVFKTENYDNNSNFFSGIANTGTSLNKGSVLPAGVYFYIIKYVDEGESRNASGYLYINQ
ncbi:gliding motility-associated C-terminal domain-containing protein, partial [Flagellimonas flava]